MGESHCGDHIEIRRSDRLEISSERDLSGIPLKVV